MFVSHHRQRTSIYNIYKCLYSINTCIMMSTLIRCSAIHESHCVSLVHNMRMIKWQHVLQTCSILLFYFISTNFCVVVVVIVVYFVSQLINNNNFLSRFVLYLVCACDYFNSMCSNVIMLYGGGCPMHEC